MTEAEILDQSLFGLDADKAKQLFNLFGINNPMNDPDIGLCHIYLADAWHLNHYGRLVTGDRYERRDYPTPVGCAKLIQSHTFSHVVDFAKISYSDFQACRSAMSDIRMAKSLADVDGIKRMCRIGLYQTSTNKAITAEE